MEPMPLLLLLLAAAHANKVGMPGTLEPVVVYDLPIFSAQAARDRMHQAQVDRTALDNMVRYVTEAVRALDKAKHHDTACITVAFHKYLDDLPQFAALRAYPQWQAALRAELEGRLGYTVKRIVERRQLTSCGCTTEMCTAQACYDQPRVELCWS